ncbi:hypothetical protein ANO14919_030730 [Xylariales sp. No.14919]|nr:hypothetical protein ANO14919_030730 [Xylariales sp. No.14919]
MDNYTICAPCKDSPLSITGNIIGILTFSVAIIAAAIYRFGLVREAAAEIYWLKEEAEVRARILEHRYNKIRARYLSNRNTLEPMESAMIEDALRRLMSLIHELRATLEQLHPRYYDQSKRKLLGAGVKYMIWRDRLRVMAERINTANDLLNDTLDAW